MKNIIFIIIASSFAIPSVLYAKQSDTLQAENYLLKKKVTLLERKNAVIEIENRDQKSEIDDWKKKMSQLERDKARMEADFRKKLDEKEAFIKKLALNHEREMNDLVKEKNRREAELNAVLETTRQAAAKRENALSFQIDSLNKSLREKDETTGSLKNDIKALNESLDGEKRSASEARKKLETRVDELEKASAEKDRGHASEIETHKKSADEQRKALETEVVTWKKLVAEKDDKYAELKKQFEAGISLFSEKTAELNTANDALKKALAGKSAEADSLRAELNGLRKKLEEKENEIKNLGGK